MKDFRSIQQTSTNRESSLTTASIELRRDRRQTQLSKQRFFEKVKGLGGVRQIFAL